VKGRNGAALGGGASAPAGTEAKRIKELERYVGMLRDCRAWGAFPEK
jgi:hypothetical protein